MENLQFQGYIILTIIFFIIFSYLLFQYKQLLFFKLSSNKHYILYLRIIILLFLIILLIDPWIKYHSFIKNSKKIGIFIDNSKSISIHQLHNEIDFKNNINKLILNFSNNNTKIQLYKIGNNIETINSIDEIKFNDFNTNFNHMEKIINNESFNKIYLISDGVSTYGKSIENIDNKNKTIINSIGIGKIDKNIDLNIKSIDYNKEIFIGDSLHLNIQIWANIINYIESQLTVYNNKDEILFYKLMSFNRGDGIYEIQCIIDPDRITKNIKISINPIDDEYNKKNNNKLIDINLFNKPIEVLFISGSLSFNTNFIKSKLNEINKSKIEHYKRLSKNKWNKELKNIDYDKFDLIILDDYPLYNTDFTYINNKIINTKINTPIVYIEGPNSIYANPNKLSKLFNLKVKKTKNNFVKLNLVNNSIINLPQVDNLSLPPFEREYEWRTNNNNNDYHFNYEDSSLAVYKNKNITAIFIPNLGISEFKVNKNIENLYNDILLYSITSIEEFIYLNTNLNNYQFGDNIYLKLLINKSLDYLNISKDVKIIAFHDSSKQVLNFQYNYDDQSYFCNFTPNLSGTWTFKGTYKLKNSEFIINPLKVKIHNKSIEEQNIYKNFLGLSKLAIYNKGKYVDIKNIDSLLYNQSDIKEEIIVKRYQISAVYTYKFWWIIIILLAIEWYYRKKIGLL